MQTVLVTGAAGYVGSILIPKLLALNYNVIAYDLFLYGNTLNPHRNLRRIKADIRDYKRLDLTFANNKKFGSVESVIHLACISNDPSFDLNPTLAKSINLDAFAPLVEISMKHGVKRFIYASSSSVYGVKDVDNVTEKVACNPLTDYSKFKLKCENLLSGYNCKAFTTVTVRPATVCGYSPRQRLDVIVNLLCAQAYHNRKMTIHGGEQLRPNIHINDMCDCYIELLEVPAEFISNEVFNFGDENLSVLQIAKGIKMIMGNDIEIDVKKDCNDPRSYKISSVKIENALGLQPKSSIKNAIVDMNLAFVKGMLPDAMTDPKYYNIKMMQKEGLV